MVDCCVTLITRTLCLLKEANFPLLPHIGSQKTGGGEREACDTMKRAQHGLAPASRYQS